MKKFKWAVIGLVAAIGINAIAGGPISFGLSNVSAKVLPVRAKKRSTSVTQWARTNLYVQGQIIQNSNIYYMVMTAGTNAAGTNAPPTHLSGEGTDGALYYYRIPTGLRKGFVLVNDSTVDVNLSFGTPAVANKGVTLKANGGAYSLDNDSYQGPVYAIAQASGSNSISVTELD